MDLKPIASDDLDSLAHRHADTLAAANEREAGQLSHFEALTGLALGHFAEQQAGSQSGRSGLVLLCLACALLDPSLCKPFRAPAPILKQITSCKTKLREDLA